MHVHVLLWHAPSIRFDKEPAADLGIKVTRGAKKYNKKNKVYHNICIT
jgi:hypothetical protein